MSHKKLYRSETDKVLAGVCGGLAEYFDIDSVLLRLIWVLIVVMSGIFPGVIVYILAILIVPKRPITTPEETSKIDERASMASSASS